MKRKFFKTFLFLLSLGFQRLCVKLGIKLKISEKKILGDDQHQEIKTDHDKESDRI